jgi:hypothetical protein
VERPWIAGCVMGLGITLAVFSMSVLAAGSFIDTAQDLIVERVRKSLQNQLGGETVSAVAAKRFLESLPPGGGDTKLIDRDRMWDLIRSRDEQEATLNRSRSIAGAREGTAYVDRNDGRSTQILEQRARELVGDLRVACTACALLFGVACWLFLRPGHVMDASRLAARIAACGATLIGSAYASTWSCFGTASQGNAMPAILVATSVVLILVADALFNSFRATRAVFDLSRFWP